MKLTKAIRESFVNSIMDDIKTGVDSAKIIELTMAEAMTELPQAIVDLWNDPDTKQYVRTDNIEFDYVRRTFSVQKGTFWINPSTCIYSPQPKIPCNAKFRPSTVLKAKVHKLLMEEEARQCAKQSMGERLTAMAAPCKTKEQLAAIFPDLMQYLPEPEPVTYPVPTIVTADFMAELKKLGVPAKKTVAVAA